MKLENVEDIYRLTPLQKDVLRRELEPSGPPQTQVCSYRLEGTLTLAALEEAWRQELYRHQALRSSFYWENLDQPVQVVRRLMTLPVHLQDWRDLSEAEQELQLERLLAAAGEHHFDPGKPPLMRIHLLRLTENTSHLVWSYHKLLLDWESQYLVLKEVLADCEAICGGRELVENSGRPHKDYFAWLKQQDFGAAEDFWRNALRGLHAPPALTGTLLSAGQARRQKQRIELSSNTSNALRDFARRHELDVKTLFVGAWALLLSRYTDNLDVILGVSASSDYPWKANKQVVVGAFTTCVPFRIAITPQTTALSWLKQLQSEYTRIRRYEHASLAEIRQWSEIPAAQPLFESVLVFNSHAAGSLAPHNGGDLKVRHHRANRPDDHPLVLEISETRPFEISLAYDGGALRQTFIAQILEHLRSLIGTVMAGSNRRLADLPLLTGEQKRRLLIGCEEFDATTKPGRCLPELFEAQVDRTPHQTAVICGDEAVTYRQLNYRANQLAHRLRQLGVGPEVTVGMYLRRSIATVTAMLGILKAGGVYVPLDPEYPQERLSYMLADTGIAALLTEQGLVYSLPAAAAASEIVCLDSDGEAIARGSIENPSLCVTGANLAYIIYTSGSTGRPKGVCLSHEAAAHHLTGIGRSFGLQGDDRVLQFASLSFDVSIEQTLATLLSGASLILRGSQHEAPAEFYRRVKRDGVTVINVPPAYWNLLAQENSLAAELGLDEHLRLVIIGGDAMPVSTLQQWQRSKLGALRLLNAYGPTETTITATLFDVPAGYGEPESVTRIPIGRPLAGRSAYVLGRLGDLTPPGAPGELCIGGMLLARGYQNSPEQTAEKFVPDEWSETPGARLYRTGDLACYNDDGELEFLGRIDQQVKIRGFRIELAEIESVLCRVEAIKEAVVVTREEEGGEKRLVAYIVPLQEAEAERIDPGALQDALRGKLPEYMIPAAFVALDELPLTLNGKVDRLALPAPTLHPVERHDGYLAPRTPVEKMLAELLMQVLNLDRVGLHDNFFDLGGHSLLAAQVVSRLREIFRIEIPLSTFFEKPIVAELAKEIEAADTMAWDAAPPLLPIARNQDLPLSFAQQRLWFLDQLAPGSAAYNTSGVIHLTGPFDLGPLEQSLNEIIRRHEVLRTTFDFKDGRPVQIINEARRITLHIEDLSGLPEGEREAKAEQLAIAEAKRPVDLTLGPLTRFSLLRLGAERHMLLVTLHHIISDAWSIGVFVRELATLYEAFVKERPSPLSELSIQFADYAAWQRAQMNGAVFDRQLSYWKEQLADAPPALELPFDRQRPPAQSFKGATHVVAFSPALTEAIKTLSRREEATMFMTSLASFAALLGYWSGEEDLVIGTSVANRNRLESEAMIGLFVNQLVLRVRIRNGQRFVDLLKQVKETTLGAYAHQDLPFDKLVEVLRPERDLGRNPLFQVLCGFLNTPMPPLETAGLKLQLAEFDNDTSVFDLSLYLTEAEDGMIGRFRYNMELFEAATIKRIGRKLETLLHVIAARSSATIDDLFAALEEDDRQERLQNRTKFAAARRKMFKGVANK